MRDSGDTHVRERPGWRRQAGGGGPSEGSASTRLTAHAPAVASFARKRYSDSIA